MYKEISSDYYKPKGTADIPIYSIPYHSSYYD